MGIGIQADGKTHTSFVCLCHSMKKVDGHCSKQLRSLLNPQNHGLTNGVSNKG